MEGLRDPALLFEELVLVAEARLPKLGAVCKIIVFDIGLQTRLLLKIVVGRGLVPADDLVVLIVDDHCEEYQHQAIAGVKVEGRHECHERECAQDVDRREATDDVEICDSQEEQPHKRREEQRHNSSCAFSHIPEYAPGRSVCQFGSDREEQERSAR